MEHRLKIKAISLKLIFLALTKKSLRKQLHFILQGFYRFKLFLQSLTLTNMKSKSYRLQK